MIKRSIETHFFKIGIFVLIGISLIVFAILFLGSGQLFKHIAYIETYFNDSIQGISEGSPVKYRGMQIGYVKDIAFTGEIYNNHQIATFDSNHPRKIHKQRSIYVKMAITSPFFTRLSKDELNEMLAQDVAQGLRIKLTPQGLTGIAYLELNFANPLENPAPTISWEPKNFYIPSIPSVMTQFTEDVQYVLDALKKADIKKMFQNLEVLTNSAQHMSRRLDSLLDQSDESVAVTIQNIKAISNSIRSVLDQVKFNPSQLILSGAPTPLDPENL